MSNAAAFFQFGNYPWEMSEESATCSVYNCPVIVKQFFTLEHVIQKWRDEYAFFRLIDPNRTLKDFRDVFIKWGFFRPTANINNPGVAYTCYVKGSFFEVPTSRDQLEIVGDYNRPSDSNYLFFEINPDDTRKVLRQIRGNGAINGSPELPANAEFYEANNAGVRVELSVFSPFAGVRKIAYTFGISLAVFNVTPGKENALFDFIFGDLDTDPYLFKAANYSYPFQQFKF